MKNAACSSRLVCCVFIAVSGLLKTEVTCGVRVRIVVLVVLDLWCSGPVVVTQATALNRPAAKNVWEKITNSASACCTPRGI